MVRDPFFIEGPAVIHFSGGRTSGMMLWRALDAHQGALPADVHVVFANTGMERGETLEFINECSLRWDVPIVWIERDGSKPSGQRWREVTYETAAREGEPFAELIRAKRFLPNAVMRFCTEELKIHAARDFMRAQGYEEWTSVLGLRRDEAARVMSVRANAPRYEEKSCPLYDAGITRADVMAFWKRQAFDLRLRTWESNCDLCFLKGRPVRERIMRDHPELVGWWVEQEFAVGGRFHAHEKGYAALLAEVLRRPMLPGLQVDPDESNTIPCTCTDRRVRTPSSCSCGKRPGQGHKLWCARVMGERRAA